jgi:hypothetical protein
VSPRLAGGDSASACGTDPVRAGSGRLWKMVEMFLPRRPVIPDGGRVIAVLVAAGAIALVAILGAHYSDTSQPGRFDRRIDHYLHGLLVDHHRLLEDVADLGGPVAITIVAVVLAAVLFLAGRPRAALLAVVAPALAAAITEWLLKPLIGRTLGGFYSFPSGHTTGIFAVAFVVVVAMLDRSAPRPRAAVALIVCVLSLAIAACVAAALVADHYHYATDTVGGAGVALATVAIVGLGIDLTFDALA